MKSEIFYKRRLPHLQPPASSFFITYRIAGSIPRTALADLSKKYSLGQLTREEYFIEYEKTMESNPQGPMWLHQENIASCVLESLLFNDKKVYDLWSATLMGNHVHTVLSLYSGSPALHVVLQNHKKFCARLCNKILNRSGRFWAEESFDTLIRNDNHFYNAIDYCVLNPVKAGLVKHWRDWKWTYIHPSLVNAYEKKFNGQGLR